MQEIYSVKGGGSVWVGDDSDYDKIKDKNEWKSVRMCKFGPGGHKETLGYSTMKAPSGKNYLHVEKDNRIAINIIDMDDPGMIPFECITLALDYIKKQLEDGYHILVACNSGHSRGPSTGLAFLRSIGEMPHNFHISERIYHVIYNRYDPGQGIRQQLRSHWTELNGMELGAKNESK